MLNAEKTLYLYNVYVVEYKLKFFDSFRVASDTL